GGSPDLEPYGYNIYAIWPQRKSLFRPRLLQGLPLLRGQQRGGGRIIDLPHFLLMRVQAAVEILDEAPQRLRANSFADLLHQISCQLANLDVLEAQLPARVAPRDLGANDRRHEGLLLRFRPSPQVRFEIGQRDLDGRTIVV